MAAAPMPAGGRRQIPTWYYAVGAGGLAVVYFLFQRSKTSAAAAAAAPAASATPVVPASSYGNAGDLAALAPYLNSLQGAQSTTVGAGSSSGVAYSPPTGEKWVNALDGTSPGSYAPATKGQTITDAAGHTYQMVTSPQQNAALQAGGVQQYTQPFPGIFVPGSNAAITYVQVT